MSKKVGGRPAWVRKLGIDDVGVDLNHGWRHSFKTRGRTDGMTDSILNAIQGHAPQTEGGEYGGSTLAAEVNEMKLFPRYTVGSVDRSAIVA